MQKAQGPNGSHQSNLFASALQGANSLFTPRRVGYTVAGAFVFAGSAMALHTGNAATNNTSPSPPTQLNAQQSNSTPPDTPPVQAPNEQPMASNSTSNSTHFSANTDSQGSTNVQLNVNGHTVPVPQNGSTSQTITNSDGTTTTVDAHGTTTTSGTSSSSSSSSFSVNVNSSSESSGGTTSQ